MGWPDDGQWAHWLLLFGQSIAVGMVVVVVYATLRATIEVRRPRAESALIGILFGLSAVACEVLAVQVQGGLMLDSRYVFVVVGSVFGGPLGASIAAVLAGAYRTYLGGPYAIIGVAAIVAMAALGVLINRRYGDRIKGFGLGPFALVGLAESITLLAVRGLFLALGRGETAPISETVLLSTFIPATALVGATMSLVRHSAWRHAQRRLADIVDTVSELPWEIDDQHRFTFVSPRFEAALGVRPADMLGRTPEELGLFWQDEVTAATHDAAWDARKPIDGLNKIVTRDGVRRILSVSGRPAYDARGRFIGYRGTAIDITDREKWRAVIASISGRVGNVVGEEFLRALVQSVADVLGAQHTAIGVYEGDGTTFRTLVRYTDGKFDTNKTLITTGMPSDDVRAGRPVLVRAGFAQRYPRFAQVAEVESEACAATPLLKSSGEVLGMLLVGFRRPLDDETVETVLRLFAGRAAAEIERVMLEEEWRSDRERLLIAQRIGQIASIERDLIHEKSVWSPELWDMLGADRSQPPGFDLFLRSVHPDDRQALTRLRQRSMAGESNEASEFRIVRPDGEVRWLYRQAELIRDSAGRPVRLVAMLQDITNRRHLEAELLRNREHLLLAQRTAGIGSAEVDLRTGKEYWSDELVNILGLDPKTMEFTFNQFIASVHPEDRAWLRALRGRNNAGVPTEPVEFRIVRPDGTVRWLRRQVRALFDKQGLLSGLIATHQDITDWRRMQEQIRESHDRLVRAQRLGQIGSTEVDLVTGASTWSEEEYRLLGLDPAAGGAGADLFLSVVHPDDREMLRGTFERNMRGEKTSPVEFRIVRPDGEVRWMLRDVEIERNDAGKPMRFLTTKQDITDRRRMEEELRLRARQLASALRVGKMASIERDWAASSDNWSPEAYRLFGFDPSRRPPSRAEFLEMVHPEDRDQFRECWAREDAGEETEPFEYRLLRRGEQTRWIYRLSEFVRDAEAHQRLIIVHQDVTEREELRRLMAVLGGNLGNPIGEDFLKGVLVNVAQVAGAELAYIGRPIDGHGTIRTDFLYADGVFVANHDIPDWEVSRAIRTSAKIVRVDRDLARRHPDAPRIFAGFAAFGGTPLLSAKGELLGMLALASRTPWRTPDHVETLLNLAAPRAAAEIERLASESEAERSRQRMAEVLAALDIARDAVILAADDGRIIFSNKAALDLLGLPGEPGQIEGKRLCDFQAGEGFETFADEALVAMREKGEWQGTGPWIRPTDHKTIFFDARMHRLPKGGFVAVGNDATQRVRLEEEERRRQEWQAQASKLEALGNLAGGIAHDFNNLLGAILGFGQFLVEDLEEESEQRHFAERIVAVSQRGRSLVQQILTFARRGPVEATDVKLAEVVVETHELLRATLPATTELSVVNRVADAVVLGDRGQLSQVFVNLCVNGSDALGGRAGAITIEITKLDRGRPELARLQALQPGHSPAGVETWTESDGTIWIVTGAKPVGAAVSIAITDTGAGIPATVGAQIFEPFFTTKGRGRGTGLGLAVVHRIVLEHGGAILVKTRQESGTTFEILLPLVLGPAGAEVRGAEGGARDADKASILVVDDDESFCAWVETALKRLGYRVQSTMDPREAEVWMQQDPHAWDLLVTDQNMPHINGEELVRIFKTHAPGTRCLICTGYSTGMSEQRARAVGADGLLLKPFDAEQLAASVARLLQGEETPTR